MSRFDYIKYDETSIQHQAQMKEWFEGMEEMVEGLPNGRAKSLVMTKLEEAYMWIGKAIRDDQIARTPITELQEQRTNS